MRDLASDHSSPILGVTSELALQVILYQIDMPCEGDECFEMNHRCNYLADKALQRYG